MATKPELKYINSFKVVYQVAPGVNYYKDGKEPEDALPMVVVYVDLIPGSRDEKNKILKNILKVIIKRYKKNLNNEECNIELNILPKFNQKIIGFIYLAGGVTTKGYMKKL